jgi:hypothetical protein
LRGGNASGGKIKEHENKKREAAHTQAACARVHQDKKTWQLLFARAEENCAGCNFQQRFLFKIIV